MPLLAPSDGASLALPQATGLPSPAEILGRPLGEHLTRGAEILDVLDHIAAASDHVEIVDYGRSVEDRPLRLAMLGRPDRLERLDDALAARRRGDLEAPAMLWLAAGVHGDEASSSEAALAVLHALAAAPLASPPNEGLAGELADVLDELLVVIDPNANPDGRARYVGWLHATVGAEPDPDPRALEHRPPWPDGRTNHYLFDLNRDWAWATQPETRQRIDALARFEPEVYVDLHEMGAERTYFFPPAAEPVHPAVPNTALDWLDVFGRANAAAFDQRSWLYFVRDVYDLFYPGYGDTYPILRGGVGMTYEMAGGERAGLAVERPSGEVLTLADRVARHTVAALTTVRTAARHARALRRDAVIRRATPPGETWLWRADQAEARALAALLERHGATVTRLETARRLRVVPAIPRGVVDAVEREFAAGTWSVTARGATRPLVEALMTTVELDTEFLNRQHERLASGLDAQVYDITAWALPIAFGVETWRLPTTIDPAERSRPTMALETSGGATPSLDSIQTIGPRIADTGTAGPETDDLGTGEPLGWIVPPSGLDGYRFLAGLLTDGLHLRWATEALEHAPAGSVFIPRAQPSATVRGSIVRRVEAAARETHVVPRPATTSWADAGATPLGADGLVPVRRPRIGLVGGEGISATDHGALWHLFDRAIGLPVSRRAVGRLDRAALEGLDVLILPTGDGYSRHAGARSLDVLRPWLKRGGVLVAVGGATRWLIEAELLELEIRNADPSLDVPGLALATLRGDHPLGVGLPTPPPALALDDLVFEPTEDPQVDVLRVAPRDPILAGAAWPGTASHLAGGLLVARRTVGDGHIVAFAQPPAFRGMWRATMPLLLDAALFLPWL